MSLKYYSLKKTLKDPLANVAIVESLETKLVPDSRHFHSIDIVQRVYNSL